MSSRKKTQRHEDTANKILQRAKVTKIARKLQNRLSLAHFKVKRGWEDLPLHVIERKFDEEIRRNCLSSNGDTIIISDTSSTVSGMRAPLLSDISGTGSPGSKRKLRKKVHFDLDVYDDNKDYLSPIHLLKMSLKIMTSSSTPSQDLATRTANGKFGYEEDLLPIVHLSSTPTPPRQSDLQSIDAWFYWPSGFAGPHLPPQTDGFNDFINISPGHDNFVLSFEPSWGDIFN